MAVFSACNQPVETRHGTSLPSAASPQLQAIDSLMWTRPDSALARIMPWLDTCLRDVACNVSKNSGDSGADVARYVSTAYDRHYANLLLAELLYKNDYPQTNREELLEAVVYFDSLTIATDTRDADTRGVSLHRADRRDASHASATDAPTIAFLTARAHYINGAGYYERDSVVEACKEYLTALEMMEEHFEEKELVGKKAQFMALTYGRLGEMFDEQLLAEPAITCYKQALLYCKREPTSVYGISVLLYNLGIQYDIDNQNDSASFYYDEALANMPDFDNLHYRDLMANKTIFAYYNKYYSSDSVIRSLKHLVALSADEEEKTTRLLTLGNILFEDRQYDSSRVYFEAVFEKQEDNTSKLIAAENLSNIYQMKGDSIKAQKYASFLASFTIMEIEKKTNASKVNEMFKDYLDKKQEKRAGLGREKAVKRALEIIISTAIVVAWVVFTVARRRSKKLLKEQQAEADRMLGETKQQHQEELEAERQTHRMEQAAMSGRLKRSNQELRELKGQIKHLDDLAAKTESATSFNEEPICRLIMERVNEGQFKSKVNYVNYKDYALSKSNLLDLRLAADLHFNQFTRRLKTAYPKITNTDLDYCCLYLLGLTDSDVAALMQRSYNTVIERNGKMRKIIGSTSALPTTLMEIANDSHQFD